MDAAPAIAGLENLTPPESVGSLIGFVHELTERTRLFEADSVPRTGLIVPHEGQLLGEKIAEKYQVAVSTQVQWDLLRERYMVRVEDARDFTKWLVRWQQWRLQAMYGEDQPVPFVLKRAEAYTPEELPIKEGPAPAEVRQLARREPLETATPRGYREFRDIPEQEKAQRSTQAPVAEEAVKRDYDADVRQSLAKGNKAVWSANTVGGSAAAGYKTGTTDAMAQPSFASGPGSVPGAGGPSPIGGAPGRYRPPMTVVLQPGQTHLAQQNDFIVAMPGVQGAVAQAMPASGGGMGQALLGQVASRLPMGRLGGVAAAVALPALGSAFARPAASALGAVASPMQAFAPAVAAPTTAVLEMAPRPNLDMTAPPLGPQHGMMTIFAPPLRVSSPQAAAAGSAVEVPVSEITARSGPLDHASLAQLKAALPPGASLIYPALPPNELPPGASNVQVAPSLLGDVLGRAYGPAAAGMAPSLAAQGASAKGPAPSEPMRAALVPEGRPAGSAQGILPGASGQAELDIAGGGMAARGNALDFLGLPVRVAPSLGGRSELRDEIAARDGAQSQAQPKSAQPEKFASLRQRMFNGQPSMNVEPDQTQWERARPSFGMSSATPASILSPTARVQPPTLTSSLPQMGSMSTGAASGATPTSGASAFQPMLARGGSASSVQDSPPAPTFGSMSLPNSSGSSIPSFSEAPSPLGSSPSASRSPINIQFPTPRPSSPPSAEVHPLLVAPAVRETAPRPNISALPVMAAAAGGPMALPIAPPSPVFESPSSDFGGRQEASSARSGMGPTMPTRSASSPTGPKAPTRPSTPMEAVTPRVSPIAPIMSIAPLTPGMPTPRRTMGSGPVASSPIQFSRPGESASSSGGNSPSSGNASSAPKSGNTSGGAAQEVDMLAREVYSLIRRRLAVEADRRGR